VTSRFKYTGFEY